MKISVYDSVVVVRDLPEQGLLRGDVGDVVRICEVGQLDVEFISPVGRRPTTVTVRGCDVRLAVTRSRQQLDG